MSAQLELELQAKVDGIRRATLSQQFWLELAREMAFELACQGPVTICDVRDWMDHQEPGWPSGNWLGAVFRDPAFEPTGRFVPSRTKGSHARPVREWRLKK